MSGLVQFLAEPLQYRFLLDGMAAAVLVGIICAVVGTFVVLRGMAFLGDALAHAILPGVAAGYLVHGAQSGPLFWWGLGTALVTTFGVGALSRIAHIREDTAIGILFSGMFALGIALISTMRSYAVDLTHLLFGNVLGVDGATLLRILVFGGGAAATILAFYKEFLVLSFDPVMAATLRLPVRFLHYLLLAAMAVTIVVALQTVGVALMMAMLVTPAATAGLLVRRVGRMMLVAALVGALSGVMGLYLSYYLGMASGAAIVLSATALFLLALTLSPRRGLPALLRWSARRRAA
jgi:manganese/iron transport system permease protein